MLPLKGVTVVSLEQAVAAPFATRQLADLGSRVVKVDLFVQNLMSGAAAKLGFGKRRSRPSTRHPTGRRREDRANGNRRALYQEER